MKAQLFESKLEKEIRLANGVQFFSEEGESKEDFIARVTEVIERDYVDTLELTEVELGSFKKKDTKTLQKARQTATGVELRMIQEILVKRGALEEPPSEGGAIYNGTLTDEDIPAEGSGKEVAEAQPEAPKAKKEKAPKKEKTPKAEKEPKEPKELKKQIPEEEVLRKLDECSKNKGKIITFINKKGDPVKSKISGVRYDKRSGMIFYMTRTETGYFGKAVWSDDYQISDPDPEPEIQSGE